MQIRSYTVMIDAPAGSNENAPYTVALVMLEEGPILIELNGENPEMVTWKIRSEGNERGMQVYGVK